MMVGNMADETCPKCAGARLLNEFGIVHCSVCGYFRSGEKVNGKKKKHVSLGEYMSAKHVLETQPQAIALQVKSRTCCHNQDIIQMGKYKVWLSEFPSKDWIRKKPALGVYLAEPWLSVMGNVLTNGVCLFTKVLYDAIYIDWPDRGVVSNECLIPVVNMVVAYLEEGLSVEIGCWGGHGRTGTFSALLLGAIEKLDGAIAIVELRKRYCRHAIEGTEQEQMVKQFCKVFSK